MIEPNPRPKRMKSEREKHNKIFENFIRILHTAHIRLFYDRTSADMTS